MSPLVALRQFRGFALRGRESFFGTGLLTFFFFSTVGRPVVLDGKLAPSTHQSDLSYRGTHSTYNGYATHASPLRVLIASCPSSVPPRVGIDARARALFPP